MDNDMANRELVETVEKLLRPQPEMTDDELQQLMDRFVALIRHPAGTDLIYYPQQWGVPANASAEEIVNEALSWRPRIVAIRVSYVRPHPRRKDLSCVGVELPNGICTQVLSKNNFRVGDTCVVALSGVRLHRGKVIEHGFVDRIFTAGEILGATDRTPGTEFSASDFPSC
jgi:Colicin immunity protein / pyocin immunity protein